MKYTFMALIVLSSLSAFSKELKVECESGPELSLKINSSIRNVNTPQVIKSLEVDQVPVKNFRDVSSMPLYQNGTFTLNLQYGQNLYNSAEVVVSNCNDEFLSSGEALVKKYVGGFAGTREYSLKCTCELK